MNVNALLASGIVVMLACAATAALVQDLDSNQQQAMQQLENQVNVCQTEVKRVESEFRTYRDAIKDSRD